MFVEKLDHCPVRRWSAEADRAGVILDGLHERFGTGRGRKCGGCANAHREHNQSTEPERESQRRASAEHVVGCCAEQRAERSVNRHDVAVKVHGGLGLASCA